jgi:GNAT superfamily N-acetyltransferase
MEWIKDDFLITDDPCKVDLDITYKLLKETYWGHRRPRDVVSGMIKYSLCFSLLHDNKQIGFARAVSDYTVFSWIADVVIHPEHRGKGLGKWMLSCIIEHPKIRMTQMVLQTGDAHLLYKKYGFIHNTALMSRSPESV